LLPLLAQRQWAVWRHEPPRNGGKPSKVPYRAKNPARHASANDASHWCDFDTSIAAAREDGFDGVCFALTDTTQKLAAFDLDDCRDPVSGAIAAWAHGLIEEAQSYVEITLSGTGLRILGYGRGNPPVHNKIKAPEGGSCEIYRGAVRFISVTGDPLDGWNRELANIDGPIDAHRRTTPQARAHEGGEHRPAD
jgi:primase-polymerase (primpol)-like protein